MNLHISAICKNVNKICEHFRLDSRFAGLIENQLESILSNFWTKRYRNRLKKKQEKSMSLVSKVVLYSSCVVSVGIIGYVHYRQKYDRDQLHLGVIRDIERQERRKAENLFILQQQRELTEKLKQEDLNNQAPV